MAREKDARDAERGKAGVPSPLLSVNAAEAEGTMGAGSCLVNLLKAIVGSGMLTLPASVSVLGVGPGLVMLVAAAVLSSAGVHLLLLACDRAVRQWRESQAGGAAGDDAAPAGVPPRQTSFGALAHATWPAAARVVDAAVVLKCTMTSAGFMTVVAAQMAELARAFGAERLTARVWLGLASAVLAPLALMRRMDSLRYTSLLGMGAVAYLFCVVAGEWAAADRRHALVWTRPPSVDMLSTFSVFVFAFTCHQSVFPLYNECRANRPRRMAPVVGAAFSLVLAMYAAFALLALGTHGPDIKGNVMDGLRPASAWTRGARLLYSALLLCSVPLQTLPARASLCSLADALWGPAQTPRARAGRHVLCTAGIVLPVVAIAAADVPLQTLQKLVAATAGTLMCYVLPGAFAWRLFPGPAGRAVRATALLLVAVGAASSALSLGSLLYALFAK